MRLENCLAVENSCLLQIRVEDLVCMATKRQQTMAGGGTFEEDYKILLSFLEKNFDVKRNWRLETGLIG